MDFNTKDELMDEVEIDLEEDFSIPFDEEEEDDEEEEENLMEGIENEVEQLYQAYQLEHNELADLDREQIKLQVYMKRQLMRAIEPEIMAAILDAYQEGMQYVRDNEI